MASFPASSFFVVKPVDGRMGMALALAATWMNCSRSAPATGLMKKGVIFLFLASSTNWAASEAVWSKPESKRPLSVAEERRAALLPVTTGATREPYAERSASCSVLTNTLRAPASRRVTISSIDSRAVTSK